MTPTHCIMDICRMNFYNKQISHNISRNMPFAPLDFFPINAAIFTTISSFYALQIYQTITRLGCTSRVNTYFFDHFIHRLFPFPTLNGSSIK
jgi:hypothetical protein